PWARPRLLAPPPGAARARVTRGWLGGPPGHPLLPALAPWRREGPPLRRPHSLETDMSYDYGPLRTYEITWKSGHVETVQGHQVTFTGGEALGALGALGGMATATDRDPRVTIHGEIDGHWRLVLSALEADLMTIRDVTDDERITGEGLA